MIGETRESPGDGPMSVAEVERELGKLRANDDGTLALRSSVLNLIVITDEESAPDVTRSVSNLAGRHPALPGGLFWLLSSDHPKPEELAEVDEAAGVLHRDRALGVDDDGAAVRALP